MVNFFGIDTKKNWFPNAKVVYLSNETCGAAFSVLAGLSICSTKGDEPIIIDLADIYFETNLIPYKNPETSGFVFAFTSKKPKYSYFKVKKNMTVEKAVEKEIISNYASTGVYAFPNFSKLLKSKP